MADPGEILDFWFGKPQDEGYGQPRQAWFGVTPVFDDEVRRRFTPDFEQASAGRLSHWEETADGCLALIILLDQCSSILCRLQARAFASDTMARQVARRAIVKGFDLQFPAMHRWFFYLPFEHSEDAADQVRSVELYSSLEPTQANREALEYALRHQRVIDRFGRFPNRNAALSRESTPEEVEFLAGPDAPF